jgi:hypothetical protein
LVPNGYFQYFFYVKRYIFYAKLKKNDYMKIIKFWSELTHILGNFASLICFLSHCGHFEPILNLLGHSSQKLIAFKYGIIWDIWTNTLWKLLK